MKILRNLLVVVVVFAAGIYGGKQFFGRSTDVPAPAPTYFSQSDNGDSTGMAAGTVTGKIINVKSGNSIQEAVGEAKPGDLIRIYPGVYHETVYIDKDNISLQGVIENGEWPVLDGEKKLNDAILYSGNGILIENNGLNEAREPIITLLIFLAVLLPLSLWIFSRAVRRAKREGSLIQY